ncbi:hypothetical protein GCM10010199_42530 [Dactylosporangium roseum]
MLTLLDLGQREHHPERLVDAHSASGSDPHDSGVTGGYDTFPGIRFSPFGSFMIEVDADPAHRADFRDPQHTSVCLGVSAGIHD